MQDCCATKPTAVNGSLAPRPWVNYHHLLYFKTIADEGGIARAAKKLRLGQPTLSTQMKRFEHVLGHALFDRTRRTLRLTEAGRKVWDYANEIFRLGDEMVDMLGDQYLATRLQVQIGAIDTVPKHVSWQVIRQARQKTDCMVTLVEGTGDYLQGELRANRLDLVLTNHRPSVSEAGGLYAKSIMKMPVAMCAAPNFAKLKAGFPASLHGQPVILPTMHSRLRHDVDNYFILRGIKPHLIAEVADYSLLKLMAQHGDGLVPIPLASAEELVASKQLVVVGILPEVAEELWFIATERRVQNPVVESHLRSFAI